MTRGVAVPGVDLNVSADGGLVELGSGQSADARRRWRAIEDGDSGRSRWCRRAASGALVTPASRGDGVRERRPVIAASTAPYRRLHGSTECQGTSFGSRLAIACDGRSADRARPATATFRPAPCEAACRTPNRSRHHERALRADRRIGGAATLGPRRLRHVIRYRSTAVTFITALSIRCFSVR